MRKHMDMAGVRVSEHDGRLMANSFNISICTSCDAAHFDCLAEDGTTVFTSAVIGPEAFRSMAAWFTEAAINHERQTGKKATS